MKDQVIMGTNGEIAVAIPLFRIQLDQELAKIEGYSVTLTNEKPLAYVIDIGDGKTCPILNATYVESKAQFLGDL